MSQSWPAPKDPDEIKDYLFRFGPVLDGATIATIVTCAVTSGDVVISGSPAIADDTQYGASANVKVRFTGGTLGETCEVHALVQDSTGQRSDLTAKLKIRAK